MNTPAETITRFVEGEKCPECKSGTMQYPIVENCYCHISPPCHRCVDNKLTCDECGSEEPERVSEERYRFFAPGISERYIVNPSRELGQGKRIYNYDYDASSGSTMVWKGHYKGDVTAQDIIDAFGDGTFGHRGPYLSNGRFTYTQITD